MSSLAECGLRPLRTRVPDPHALVALTSQSHLNRATESFLAGYNVIERRALASSLKFGLIAKGVSYGIVGVLAIKLAAGDGGTATSRPGALHALAQHEFGTVLLVLLAIGLACYALWRLVQAFAAQDEPLPRAGDRCLVLGGDGRPLAIVRTTDVRVGPLSSVDDRFAWDEGEGDRTRAWWLDAHTRFFSRQCTAMGLTFSDDIGVVFERFELVWPTIRT